MQNFSLFLIALTVFFASGAALASDIHSVGGAKAQVIFNEPGLAGNQTRTIEDEILRLIDLAASGSKIQVAMYTFRRPDLAKALIAAAHKGVNVEAVLDASSRKHAAVLMLKQEPKIKLKICGRVKWFVGGCVGLIHQHNKFVLFSQLTDGSRNVVAMSSANATDSQLGHYNDLLIVRDDTDLYQNMSAYFANLQEGGSLRTFYSRSAVSGIETYFSPRSSDPILGELGRVRCHLPGSEIRITQSRFDDHRESVAKQLKVLMGQGCLVRVIARHEPEHHSPGEKVKELLGSHLVTLPYQSDEGTGSVNSNHSKTIAIRASIDNSQEMRYVVLTGSHNLNGSSLSYNDETLLRIESAEILQEYFGFWARLYGELVQIHSSRQ